MQERYNGNTFVQLFGLHVDKSIGQVWRTRLLVMRGIVDEFLNMLNGDTVLGCELLDLLFASCNKVGNILGEYNTGLLVALSSDFLRVLLCIGGLRSDPSTLHGFFWVALGPSIGIKGVSCRSMSTGLCRGGCRWCQF